MTKEELWNKEFDMKVGSIEDEHAYIITFPISNAINPTFLVGAGNLQEALDLLVDTWEEQNVFKMLWNSIDYLCDDGHIDAYLEENNMVIAGNHCYAIDVPNVEEVY